MNAIANRVKSKMNEQFNSVMSPSSDLLNLHHNNIDFINEINISNNITFDHNYSELTNSLNNSAGNLTVPSADSVDSEVTCLKNLLLPHLQLIQQQNEQIIIQDKHIRSLQFQNAMLKQRLRRMEMRSDLNNHTNNKDTIYSERLLNSDEDSYPQLEDLLPTDEIPEENFQEFPDNCDNKNNIQLLDIHLNENNVKEKHSDSEENTQPEEPLVVETEEVVEEGFEEFEDEEFTYSEEEMGIKRDQVIEEKTEYKPRSLLARNQSPTLTSSLTKFRDELTKSVLQTPPRATSRAGSNVDDNNENREIEEIPVLTNNTNLSEGRRDRLKKRRSNRQRLTSSTSVLSTNSSDSKKLKVSSVTTKREPIQTTEHMYYTQMGDTSLDFGPVDDLERLLDTGTTTTNLEVPSWRKKVISSCYSMEGTENLDDDVFNKRHHRLEINERRRKKWDVQRIREQRHIERLKQRQERIGSGARTDDHIEEQPVSLWPSLDNIKFIEITEHLPVTSFGCTIAQLTPSEFCLPWLNRNSDNSNIHITKKSSRKSSTSSRRKGNKR